MTTTEITPELLRDVADWIDGTGHGLGPGAALRDEADRIERKQSDEKRIDELARVWVQVYDNHQGPFDDRVRDGIRAVLARIEQDDPIESAKAETEYWTAGRDKHGNIRLNQGRGLLVAEAEDTRDEVQGWVDHATPGSKWERQYQAALDLLDREAAQEQARKPRTWYELCDVPEDVQLVTDNTGSRYRRFKPGPRGWEVHASGTMWSRDMDDDLAEWAPFTEVIDHG